MGRGTIPDQSSRARGWSRPSSGVMVSLLDSQGGAVGVQSLGRTSMPSCLTWEDRLVAQKKLESNIL